LRISWFSPAVWVAAGALGCCAVACGSDPLQLGDDPDFYLWSDFESGDIGDFTDNGVSWENAGGQLQVVDSPTVSGGHALRSRVVPGNGDQSAALVILEHMPEEAYYSAWFYVPQVPAPSYYWVFFKLGVPEDGVQPQDVWAFDLDPAGSDAVRLRPYSPNDDTGLLVDRPIPVATWFQVEGYLKASTNNDGIVRLWVDGTKVFEFEGRMDPSRGLNWTLGGGSERLEQGAATLIIDDAAVTRRRLGPNSGPFRGR
jgi:hypothetical protein